MQLKRWIGSVVCLVLILFSPFSATVSVNAASGPTLTTTLKDNSVQKGSKKTFDVWAKNAAGNKIKATVKLNNQKIEPTWDDTEKTSYTLVFTKEGENIVTVSATSDGGKNNTLTYHINYVKTASGEAIGSAIWSVEMFTIGCGYMVYPIEIPIYEGETAAEQLVRLLHDKGFVGYYGGTLKSSFYLAYIADGTVTGSKYNNYKKSGTSQNPKKLNISPTIPSILIPHLEDTMTFFDPNDYDNNWLGYLGEFAITNGSGWMYSVNNIFPNVGFADTYLSDGDIVRVQYTLGYGADIGGFGATGTEIPDVENQPTAGYFDVADKDRLTEAIFKTLSSGNISKKNVKNAYEDAIVVMTTLNASQNDVDKATKNLEQALLNPGSETNDLPSDMPLENGVSGSYSQSNDQINTKKNSNISATSPDGKKSESDASDDLGAKAGVIGNDVSDDLNMYNSESLVLADGNKDGKNNNSSQKLAILFCFVSVAVFAGAVFAYLKNKKSKISPDESEGNN